MADKISENAGFESGKITPEQLVEAIKLVGDFAKKNPEAAVKLVKESLASNSTTPGVSFNAPGSGAPVTPPGAASF